MKYAGKVLLAIPALATLEPIFSHLVSVESIRNVAPLAILDLHLETIRHLVIA
jgi:hypothetical protein